MVKPYFSNIAIVTTKSSWFVPYSQKFEQELKKLNLNAKLFFKYEDIDNDPEIVFILSYFYIIKPELLKKHKYNFVVHSSDLPEGKGWAPVFWQILEGKNRIPTVLFEAVEGVDAGDIYLKDFLVLNGTELHDEIRAATAHKDIELCYKLLFDFPKILPQKQSGIETFYRKRTPMDSELDPSKSLKELFQQLRIADNEQYPAFFYYKGMRYTLKINKDES